MGRREPAPEQQREFMEIVADERSKSMYINAFAAGSLLVWSVAALLKPHDLAAAKSQTPRVGSSSVKTKNRRVLTACLRLAVKSLS